MNDGASLKAVCRCPGHKNCSVWVTVRAGTFRTVLIDILEWLAYGRDHDAEDHKKHAATLKRCHRMKPKMDTTAS